MEPRAGARGEQRFEVLLELFRSNFNGASRRSARRVARLFPAKA